MMTDIQTTETHRITLRSTINGAEVETTCEYLPCELKESTRAGYHWYYWDPLAEPPTTERHAWRGRNLDSCRTHARKVHEQDCEAAAYVE